MEHILLTANKWALHEEANEAFKVGYFRRAIKLYTHILEEINPNDTDILSNRSLAYLKVGMYKLSFLDAETVLQIDSSHQKAIVRKVKSLWGLRQYEEAIHVIRTKISKTKLQTPFYQDLELKSQKYLRQSKGEYDLLEIINLPQDEYHEIGEYTGPIEIVTIPGKGRGVVATADISPGQLVSVTKAFAIGFGMETHVLRIMKLSEKIIEKLHFPDEELRKEFEELPACAAPNDPPSTWVWENTWDPEGQTEIIRQMDLRVKDNMFVNYRSQPIAYGIWTSASYFNNDCVDANVHIQHFGDVMMIRALNHIPKGQELTINYFSAEEPTRKQQLRDDRKFECKCRLCVFELGENEKTTNEVDKVLASLKAELESIRNDRLIRRHLDQDQIDLTQALENLVLSSGSSLHSTVERQIARMTIRNMEAPKDKLKTIMAKFRRIAALRADNPSLNVAMADPRILEFALILFANHYFAECVEVIETARQTLNCAESIVTHVLLLDELIVSCNLKLGNFNEIIKWVDILKADLIRAYGTTEVLHEIGVFILKQFENLKIGLDFFSLYL